MPEPKTPEENDRSDSNDDVSLTEAQLAELKWRIAAYKASPEDSIPWAQIKAEALARCRKQ